MQLKKILAQKTQEEEEQQQNTYRHNLRLEMKIKKLKMFGCEKIYIIYLLCLILGEEGL